MTHSTSRWLVVLSLIFTMCLAIAFVYEQYAFVIIPPLLVGIYAVFKQPHWAFFLIVFFVPLSVNTEEFMSGGFSLFVPTEPLLIALMLIYFVVNHINPHFDRRILQHPILVSYSVYLSWVFLISFVSGMPAVSFKFLVAHCWLFFPIYIFASSLFKNIEYIRFFFWLLICSMAIVATYTLVNHAMNGFAEKPAHWVMAPFFKDHTSYGAILAMIYPIVIGFIATRQYKGLTQGVLWFLLALFTMALVFSYTRAAWVSLAGALALWGVIYFRIRIATILIVLLGAGFFLYVSYDKIMMSLEKNETDSSADFGDHLTSMSNISTDASNVERLNRWDCAISMFKEQPFTGWGPGTYQFFYAPFQRPENMTIISTYDGNGGNAHSEYLGPLAESGWPGLLFLLIAFGTIFVRAYKNYRRVEDKELRTIYLASLLGLVTYFIHGFLNNYLDTDKAAMPVWGVAGLITAIDLYHANWKKKDEVKEVA